MPTNKYPSSWHGIELVWDRISTKEREILTGSLIRVTSKGIRFGRRQIKTCVTFLPTARFSTDIHNMQLLAVHLHTEWFIGICCFVYLKVISQHQTNKYMYDIVCTLITIINTWMVALQFYKHEYITRIHTPSSYMWIYLHRYTYTVLCTAYNIMHDTLEYIMCVP